MALERATPSPPIGAVARPLVPRAGGGAVALPTAPAALLPALPPEGIAPLLRLRVFSAFDGGLLARSADGLPFQIPTSALAGQAWAPGQLLLVRVVSTSPQLELAVLGPADEGLPARAGLLAGQTPAALLPDQAGMHRLLAPPLDVAALAAQWRAMVLQRLQRAVPAAASSTPASAGTALVPLGAALAPSAEASTLQPTLVFQTLLWLGVGLTFWPAQPRPRGARHGRPTGAMAQNMGLLLLLPGLGEVRIDVSMYGSAVALNLAAQSAESVPLLRSRTALIAASLARAGLRLMQCQVAPAPPGQPMMALPATAQQLCSVHTALPPGLFRAAAEVLNALSPPFQ
ncbi:hypothetical protein B2J88_11025 [Rhodococcus sp. SRB_17]|nr:hypothetical protein [Rhodococcus sp. SRB_17]